MLKGKLVSLRPVEKDDLKALHALTRNVELIQYGNGNWEPESLARWEKSFEKHLEDKEPSFLAIEADGQIIGDCGLHHSHRRDSSTQFGIGIYHPEYVGRGYGREAIALLLDWAFYDQNWRRVYLEALAVNERALKAYRKIGFVEEGRLRQHTFFRGQYVDIVHMGMLRDEWTSLREKQLTHP
ncbi:GNAT family N-acetyltransferase [Chloroflexia bacterium SDU3-3]|nr:GNAT family N-acetyltransferase [Chloroflexia bacterium SDU3-3]